MVAAAAFVIGFALIGITVVLVAMRGGPRGVRESMHTQSPWGRRAVAAIIAGVCLIFGVGIPAAVMASNDDNDSHAKGGVKLSAAATAGRHLFAKNCGTCHTLSAANSSGRVGPNLDQLRPPDASERVARRPWPGARRRTVRQHGLRRRDAARGGRTRSEVAGR